MSEEARSESQVIPSRLGEVLHAPMYVTAFSDSFYQNYSRRRTRQGAKVEFTRAHTVQPEALHFFYVRAAILACTRFG
jgi:hypothetical protein